jgi:hypothetical protein
MPIKIKMELPYEPMKRTTTALKQEKEEAFMMVAALPDIQLEETKTSTIANALLKNDGFNYATIIIETRFRKANTYFI